MWGLQLYSSMGMGFSTKSFSDDLYVFRISDYSEHETFYLGSPHLDDIPLEQSDLAYYRSKAFMRILNGCLLLSNNSIFDFGDEIRIFEENGDSRRVHFRKSDFTIMEYEELINPFTDKEIIDTRAGKSPLRDCLILAKEDPIVRQSIICLSLANLDALYFLTNIYKIYENVFLDINIPKNSQSREFRNFCDENPEFAPYLKFFVEKFAHYANSEKGSGILSRHGNGRSEYEGDPLDFGDIDFNARQLMNYWLRLKMADRFGYYFKLEYKKPVQIALRAEDFKWD